MFYYLIVTLIITLFTTSADAMESPQLQWRHNETHLVIQHSANKVRNAIDQTHSYTSMLETYLQTKPACPLPMLRTFQLDVIQKALKTKNERTAVSAVNMLNTQLAYLAWLSAHMTPQEEENFFEHLNQQFDVVDGIRNGKQARLTPQERIDVSKCAIATQIIFDGLGLPATGTYKQLRDKIIERKIYKANHLKKFNLIISEKTDLKALLAANFKTLHDALIEDFESAS